MRVNARCLPNPPLKAAAGKGKKVDASQLLPVEPEKFKLVGHRDMVPILALSALRRRHARCEQVTSVAFHPVYTVVASGGEDSTIKARADALCLLC